MNTNIRFVRGCVMALGMVLAIACGHGPQGLGGMERVDELPQAATLAWPDTLAHQVPRERVRLRRRRSRALGGRGLTLPPEGEVGHDSGV